MATDGRAGATVRVRGRSGEVFPPLARAVVEMVEIGEQTRATGLGMLLDMIKQFATRDPEGWREPERSLAEHPLVFEALQRARIEMASAL